MSKDSAVERSLPPMKYTLGTAAKATGVAKTTLRRKIKKGEITAHQKEDGTYEIDPAELHRVYPAVQSAPSSEPDSVERSLPVAKPDDTAVAQVAQVEVDALKREIELYKDRIEELKVERDRWHAQAERLALTDERKREPEVSLEPRRLLTRLFGR